MASWVEYNIRPTRLAYFFACERNTKSRVYDPAFSSESTHNAFFSTRHRCIHGALITQGRRQSAKKRAIDHQTVER
jgi:hypothetical protein